MAIGICNFDRLSEDVLELIFGQLPVASLLTAGQVCKNWCMVARSRRFVKFYDDDVSRKSWFFQCCVNFLRPEKSLGYGYDPQSKQWHLISSKCFPRDQGKANHAASPDGSLYTVFSLTYLTYKREFLSNMWEHAPAMNSSRDSPLMGLLEDRSSNSQRIIVAGGVTFFEEDQRAVEIYDAASKSWEVCESLPLDFSGICSRHWMTSAAVSGQFYVAEKASGSFAVFDLESRRWSGVRTLRPSGVVYSHLLSCNGHLLLAGSCYQDGKLRLNLWEVNEATMECGQLIGCMPPELCEFIDPPGADGRDSRSQCTASGDLIYFFSGVYCREQSTDNRVVVCDLSGGVCEWRLLPPLPSTGSFNYIFGFSSPVRLGALVC